MKRRIVLSVLLACGIGAAAFVRPPHPGRALTPVVAAAEASPPHGRSTGTHRRGHPRARHGHHAHARRRKKKHATPAPVPVDVNQASAETLARIDAIGPRLAARIVAVRELSGPFERLDDLEDVDGITARRLDRLARFIVVR